MIECDILLNFMFTERKLFTRQTAPAWLLSLILFLSACGDVAGNSATTSNQNDVQTHLADFMVSDTNACKGNPNTPVVSHEADAAGSANVEGVMDASNYTVEVCSPTEFDATRTQKLSAEDFPRKEMIAMANGDYYTFEYTFDAQSRVLRVELLQERSILPVGSDVRETGIVAQTSIGEVVIGTEPVVVVVDFSASRLAASRYYQRRFLVQ